MKKHQLHLLWSSISPMISSGYGRVTKEIVMRLLKCGFSVTNHSYQSRGDPHTIDNTFKILENGASKYGTDVIPEYVQKYGFEALITLYDPWAFSGEMGNLNVPWIPYVPIDAEPLNPILTDKLDRAYKVICFSEFAKKELDKIGIKGINIPHGVDTKTFKPLSKEERMAIRKEFNIPNDVFLIGSVGTNLQDRKDFPRMLWMFSEFLKKTKANAYLYIHANPQGRPGASYDLDELTKVYGIQDRVILAEGHKDLVDFPFSNEGMVRMYNIFDVYLSTSRAEGCGLPILEAQSCGIPAIVPDNSAQPEWVKEHGWIIPCNDHVISLTTPQHNKWYLINIKKCVDILEDVYKNTKKREKYGKMARKAMLGYDWDKIVKEKWIPFLDEVYKELHAKTRKTYVRGKTHNIRNHSQDAILIRENIIEQSYTRHIELNKKDTWLDIGGHIGTFAIDIADKVKEVYCYEPDKDNFKLLKKNVEENHLKNVFIFNEAVVGNEDKKRDFFVGVNSGAGSLMKAGIKWGGEIQKVKCENINTILKKHKINRVKIDCEGGEYEIIKAMDLSKIDEIIFEYHFNVLRMAKYDELLELLSENFIIRKAALINPFTDTIIHCRKYVPKIQKKQAQKT